MTWHVYTFVQWLTERQLWVYVTVEWNMPVMKKLQCCLIIITPSDLGGKNESYYITICKISPNDTEDMKKNMQAFCLFVAVCVRL